MNLGQCEYVSLCTLTAAENLFSFESKIGLPWNN